MNVRKIILTVLIAFFSLAHFALAALDPATVQKLVAGDGAANDEFGYSVAVDGDTALIGAEQDDDKAGSAYVFVRSADGKWTEQAKLIATDRTPLARFGCSVSLENDTALIGAKNEGEYEPGAAYVFVRSENTWTQQAKLTASNRPLLANFGVSVSLSGSTALIGVDDKSAAYVFVRSETSWTEQAKLTPDDGEAGREFGVSVSLEKDTALIGATGYNNYTHQGAAYIFVRSGTSWTQQTRLTADDGASDDMFGLSVSLSGDTALIGTEFKNAAYVFSRSGTTWTQQAKLTGADNPSSFGRAVSLNGDTALIGGCGYQSSAYVFVRSGTMWTQTKLVLPDGSSSCAVAVDNDTSLIGCYFQDVYAGAAYAYGSSSGTANKAAVPAVMHLLLGK
jgi:hypothetical protein